MVLLRLTMGGAGAGSFPEVDEGSFRDIAKESKFSGIEIWYDCFCSGYNLRKMDA